MAVVTSWPRRFARPDTADGRVSNIGSRRAKLSDRRHTAVDDPPPCGYLVRQPVIVRPGDTVVHRVVSDVPVKALVIWAPGGEADRIAGNFRQRPVVPR
ncbi:MAG: hypothetical protein IIA27_11105 [Gemmatimonadetes bacterium]|nr:hypothetical protein [Gemmatimonadota bacterium]